MWELEGEVLLIKYSKLGGPEKLGWEEVLDGQKLGWEEVLDGLQHIVEMQQLSEMCISSFGKLEMELKGCI